MAGGAYIAVLNDDAWVDPDWAARIIETFKHDPDVGSVASLVLRPGGQRVDSAGDHLDVTGRASNIGWGQYISEIPLEPVEVFSPAGSCAAYRRDALHLAGAFDEDFVAYLDDIDLGFRLQLLGFKCVFNPACRAQHIGGGNLQDAVQGALLDRTQHGLESRKEYAGRFTQTPSNQDTRRPMSTSTGHWWLVHPRLVCWKGCRPQAPELYVGEAANGASKKASIGSLY